jgi:hypothetical protein
MISELTQLENLSMNVEKRDKLRAASFVQPF